MLRGALQIGQPVLKERLGMEEARACPLGGAGGGHVALQGTHGSRKNSPSFRGAGTVLDPSLGPCPHCTWGLSRGCLAIEK